jgi:excisionase family DNA binding protein
MTAQELGLHKVLYSINETAELLSTSRDAVYDMVHRGKLRLLKLGPKKSRILGAEIALVVNELREPIGEVAPT